MWLLKRLNDGTTKYLISVNKSYTVGRKNCDFILEDDASVSRKHCTIHIAKQSECPFTVNTITGVWLVDEQSKYGTYLMSNNDWTRINANENKKLTSVSVIKFGLMGNIWSLEFKPVVACASGIPTEQKKNLERILQSIDGFLRNAWCKECSLVIVNEITLTVKVVLALINGVPIVTPNYIQKLVESVKNQSQLPIYEDYRPIIKESILDRALVSLDTKNHRKELFKGMKFVIPTKKQVDMLKEVITSAGGSYELLSVGGKLERFAENNVIVIQLPLNSSGVPEELSKLYKEVTTLLKNNFARRIVPESEIAQAVAYSSTEKFCNPKSTCFNIKIGEWKEINLGPVIVEETPIVEEVKQFVQESVHSQLGVVPSSETMESESHLNLTSQSQLQGSKVIQSQRHLSTSQQADRKRIHSPNQEDHKFQKKKARNKAVSNDDNQAAKGVQSLEKDNPSSNSKSDGKSNTNKQNQTKPSYITNYFQKQQQEKQVPQSSAEKPQLTRQASSSFWNIDAVNSKSIKRKISVESDDSLDNSGSSWTKPKRPKVNASKQNTPERCIDTPREVVEVLNENSNSRHNITFPSIRKITVEEDDDRTGYFGKDRDANDLQLDELNNTILSLTIISPAFLKEDGSLIDPPNEPVNVKRFKKKKILSPEFLRSLAEQDDELSDGEWIEPHSNRLDISLVDGSD